MYDDLILLKNYLLQKLSTRKNIYNCKRQTKLTEGQLSGYRNSR